MFAKTEDAPTFTNTIEPEPIKQTVEPTVSVIEKTPYRCQGKTRCSDFLSCEEALFYQTHCDGVKLDKDHDGIPCEGTLCQHQ